MGHACSECRKCRETWVTGDLQSSAQAREDRASLQTVDSELLTVLVFHHLITREAHSLLSPHTAPYCPSPSTFDNGHSQGRFHVSAPHKSSTVSTQTLLQSDAPLRMSQMNFGSFVEAVFFLGFAGFSAKEGLELPDLSDMSIEADEAGRRVMKQTLIHMSFCSKSNLSTNKHYACHSGQLMNFRSVEYVTDLRAHTSKLWSFCVSLTNSTSTLQNRHRDAKSMGAKRDTTNRYYETDFLSTYRSRRACVTGQQYKRVDSFAKPLHPYFKNVCG